MKQLFYTAIFIFSTFSFGQNTGLIIGKILDKELNNSPLVLANVSIKGTTTEANTDLSGMFVVENLKDGDYTLVCSFVGYETQEIMVHVDAFEPTEIKLSLAASTVSLLELASLATVAQKEDKLLSVLN